METAGPGNGQARSTQLVDAQARAWGAARLCSKGKCREARGRWKWWPCLAGSREGPVWVPCAEGSGEGGHRMDPGGTVGQESSGRACGGEGEQRTGVWG